MGRNRDVEQLLRGWTKVVRSGVLRALALANYVADQAARKCGGGQSTSSDDDRKDREIAVLREILAFKDARMERIDPHRRPHYAPPERMRILELKAQESWSLERTAELFQVTEPTVASWLTRLDEQGPQALVQTPEPVNKFSLLVGYLVKRFKTLHPELGKRKLAATLARAGLHLGATTVARWLKTLPVKPDEPAAAETKHDEPSTIHAAEPHDVWHVDLTVVPTGGGFWCPWLPFALPQRLPFGWWIAAVVDSCSRRVLGLGCFEGQPTAHDLRKFLERTIRDVGVKPKTILCDRGKQFDCDDFRAWCRRRKIAVRYGAVGKHGSIAVVERFLRTLKEYLRTLSVVPSEPSAMRHELRRFAAWFNEHRPHEFLGGRTPNEAYEKRYLAHRKPRHEPRAKWPRGSPCARPWALARGRPGAKLELVIEYHGGRRHLPIVTLQRVA